MQQMIHAVQSVLFNDHSESARVHYIIMYIYTYTLQRNRGNIFSSFSDYNFLNTTSDGEKPYKYSKGYNAF